MLAFLRLIRLPALFTTFPDVLAGYMILRQGEIQPLELTCLLLASACLYLSGMVWNDVFDVAQDREERPTRPIPAGDISRRIAIIIACVLMILGIVCAALVGICAVLVAVVLAISILLYDGGGKKTVLGPVLMGSCRCWNVLLGASGVTTFTEWQNFPALIVAVIMGLYVSGVTLFARSEAKQSSRLPLYSGFGLCLVALASWMICASLLAPATRLPIVIGMLILICLQLLWRSRTALVSGQARAVQQSVRMMLLTIPMLEAISILAYGGENAVPIAIVAALMMIPGQILSRYIPMT